MTLVLENLVFSITARRKQNVSYRLSSGGVGKSLLRALPPVDWDSLTEDEAAFKLALIRQICRDFYRSVRLKPVQITSPSPFMLDDIIEESLLMKRVIFEQMLLQAERLRRFERPGKLDHDESIWIKNPEPKKFEVRGVGKNPMAVPHISKPPRKR
jgi:hypothetical protein